MRPRRLADVVVRPLNFTVRGHVRYPDGQEVLVGDVVSFVNDRGIVVGLIGTEAFLAPFKAEEWNQLRTGVLVRTDRGALVRFEDEDHLGQIRITLERRRDL